VEAPVIRTARLAVAIALVVSLAAPAIGDDPSARDLAFRAQVTKFVEAELQLYPERSTHLGDHRFDDRVDDVSARGIDEVIRHAKKWIALFGADDPKQLSAANEADREWLTAHLDGELPASESAEARAWIAGDAEAAALLAELQNTRKALAGHEEGIRLPEPREFFWSKIEREINRQEQTSAVRDPSGAKSWLWWLRLPFASAGAVAIMAILLLVLVMHPGPSAASQYAEVELAASDMTTSTFRDQDQRMTVVWLHDREEGSEFTTTAPVGSVQPE